jgi:hypothetical protein
VSITSSFFFEEGASWLALDAGAPPKKERMSDGILAAKFCDRDGTDAKIDGKLLIRLWETDAKLSGHSGDALLRHAITGIRDGTANPRQLSRLIETSIRPATKSRSKFIETSDQPPSIMPPPRISSALLAQLRSLTLSSHSRTAHLRSPNHARQLANLS